MSDAPAARLRAGVDTVLGWVLAAMMGLAVLNVLWQVFTRYVLSNPSAFTDELSRYLLIWVGLLGAAYATGRRMHLAIDLLPAALSERGRAALGLVIDGFVLLFALLVMVFGGSRLVVLQLLLEQTSAALQVPLGYVYLVLPVSGLLISFYAVLHMADHLRLLRAATAPARAGSSRRDTFPPPPLPPSDPRGTHAAPTVESGTHT
jgi:TRAP-type C4-dicarboxylate transport system permease small subunit